MAQSEYPTEYDRGPTYLRPIGGIVRVMDRQLKGKVTQVDSLMEVQSNG